MKKELHKSCKFNRIVAAEKIGQIVIDWRDEKIKTTTELVYKIEKILNSKLVCKDF